ncbi:MAG TPA: HEAT repeat domain-containing protein, partial [Ktedonobacteraceae bacterium]|nr:HEAT repeat domain-containing protein [Ktedonobacteraceae bacterium]
MQHYSNHSHPHQPVQAPPSLQARVFERIHQAEQLSQEKADFTAAFASSDWTLRLAAVEQLAQVEREIALPWLERALSDEHPSVRAWVIHVAGQHQVSASALSDPDWQVREAALLALKEQDAPLS